MTTKLLIGISSCNKFETNGFNDALRSTCLNNLKTDYKIFHGDRIWTEGDMSLPVFSKKINYAPIEIKANHDVVISEVNDDFYGIMAKYVSKCRYALDRGYDYLFNCYYDTYFVENRLLNSGFEKYDYCGKYGAPYILQHCQGGAGVFLSKKMCKIVCDEMETKTFGHPTRISPNGEAWLSGKENPKNLYCTLGYGYGEDLWTGVLFDDHKEELTSSDFTPYMVDLFKMSEDGPRKHNAIMAMHMSPLRCYDSGVEYSGEHMLQKHKEWINSWL